MSTETNLQQITFKADGLSVEQDIEICNENDTPSTMTVDGIVDGLNSGALTTSLDYDLSGRGDADITGSWIRDNNGNGVAIIAAQRVAVGDFNNFDREAATEQPAE